MSWPQERRQLDFFKSADQCFGPSLLMGARGREKMTDVKFPAMKYGCFVRGDNCYRHIVHRFQSMPLLCESSRRAGRKPVQKSNAFYPWNIEMKIENIIPRSTRPLSQDVFVLKSYCHMTQFKARNRRGNLVSLLLSLLLTIYLK